MNEVSRRALGDRGEEYAAGMLEKEGCTVLCRNFKGQHGELDIIAEKGAYILFIEVKTRREGGERPVFAVDQKKMNRIIETAREFLYEYRDNNYISALAPRFDVVEVWYCGEKISKYNHIEDIYR